MPRLRLGVALLVPRPVADEVDVLRRACGAAVDRIPPHCTLVPPVNVRQDRLDEALEVLRTAAAATRPLPVRLGPPATFLPDNPVLYLAVDDGDDSVRRLRDRVFVEPLSRPLTWTFVPHVTLVDGGPPPRLGAAAEALADYRVEVTFTAVHLLQEQRDGRGQRVWRPLADAALSRPAVLGRGGRHLELSVGEQLDPEAAAFSEREWAVLDHERYGDLWPRDLVVTARDEGAVVGTVMGWTTGRSVHLADLVVAASRRGEGIGSSLVAAFLSEAVDRGCTLARTRTEADGPAEGFWRRIGWVEEGRFDHYTLDRDVVQLRRAL